MRGMLGRLFKKPRPVRPSGVDELARLADDDETPRYPPFARGLPNTPIDRVIKTQEKLIRDLRHSIGLAPELFDEIVWPVLERLAGWMHLLPASEAHHHRMTGGLFRHSLEVGLFAARAAEGTVFVPMGTPVERRAQEPRWHAAAAIAGLLHDIGKPVSDVVVTDTDGQQWNPYTEALATWINRARVERYYVQWRSGRGRRHEQFAALVAERLLPEATSSWLADGGPEILEHLLSTITASITDTHYAKIVFNADHTSVERDLRANNVPTEPSLGVPVERHLLDAMRRLVRDGVWQVNTPGARVWVVKEGVFVVWERGTEDILDCLSRDRIPGIPRHHDALADALIERGHAHTRVLDDGTWYRYWLIQPACVARGTVVLKALKLASAELLWPESEPPTVTAAFVGERVAGPGGTDEQPEPAPATESQKAPDSQVASTDAITKSGTPGASPSEPRMPGSTPTQEEGSDDEERAAYDSTAIGTRLTVSRADNETEPMTARSQECGGDAGEETAELERPSETSSAGEGEPAATGELAGDAAGATTAEATPDATPEAGDDLERLRGESSAGAVLAALIDDLREGRRASQDVFVRTQAGLMLIYPESVRGHVGKPNKFVQWMKADEALIPDPDNDLRPVRTVDGHAGLVLSRALARRLEPYIPSEESNQPEQTMAQEPEPITATGHPEAPSAESQAGTARRSARRRGPGQPSSDDLARNQASSAIERLAETLRGQPPEELPGDLRPDDSTPGWLAVPLDAAVRFTGVSKTRLRLSVGAESPIQIRQGHVYVPVS